MKATIKLYSAGFTSDCEPTPQFKRFSSTFKRELIKELKGIAEVTKFSTNHFYCSGFFRDSRDNCYYFCLGDVRHHRIPSVYIRTAKDESDFMGGRNHSVNLHNLKAEVSKFILSNIKTTTQTTTPTTTPPVKPKKQEDHKLIKDTVELCFS